MRLLCVLPRLLLRVLLRLLLCSCVPAACVAVGAAVCVPAGYCCVRCCGWFGAACVAACVLCAKHSTAQCSSTYCLVTRVYVVVRRVNGRPALEEVASDDAPGQGGQGQPCPDFYRCPQDSPRASSKPNKTPVQFVSSRAAASLAMHVQLILPCVPATPKCYC